MELEELFSKEFIITCIDLATQEVERKYGIKRDKFEEKHFKEVYESSIDLHVMCLNEEGYYEVAPNEWVKVE